jgi:cell division protein FtsQ
MFYGPGDGVVEVASQFSEFSKALKKANLEIANLALTPRRAWQITTTNGMVVELGRVEMQPRLEKFVSVYSSTIAGLNMKVTYADLRYPNGFAVRRPVDAKPIIEEKDTDATADLKLNSNKSLGTLKPSISKPDVIKPSKTKPTDIIKQQT